MITQIKKLITQIHPRNHVENLRNHVEGRKGKEATILVEFAMAAAGLVALAFVVTRVGMWLNTSMQTRNDLFQGSRMTAASIEPGAGAEAVDPVGEIHLIGPTGQSTGGLGPQADSSYDTSCGSGALAAALAKRLTILSLIIPGGAVEILRYSVGLLHSEAYQLVVWANELGFNATTIADWLVGIRDNIDPQLEAIHNDPIVQGTGAHEIIVPPFFLTADCSLVLVSSNPQDYLGLHNINERMDSLRCQLDYTITHSLGWTIYKLEQLENARIHIDPDHPYSTAWLLDQAKKACEGGLAVEGDWPITSCFGPAHPPGGIDIGASLHTHATAFKGGTVIVADSSCGSCDTGYGNYVVILHDDGTKTLYAHLNAIFVSEGGVLDLGDSIGEVGYSGHVIPAGVGGTHLHFEYLKPDGLGGWMQQDPFEGAGCTACNPGDCPIDHTTSDALGSSFGGTCDLDLIDQLEDQLAEYQTLADTIPGEVDPYEVGDLAELRALRGDWIDEWNALYPLYRDATNLEAWKGAVLDNVDGLLNAWHTSLTWKSLWAELAAQHGKSVPLAPDLSQTYWDEVRRRDDLNDATLGEPGMIPDLEEVIRRLWWLIGQRLDLGQSMQDEFDGEMQEHHDEYVGGDFSVPDAIECVGPAPCHDGGPAKYLELVRLIEVLREKSSEIHELMIDAEGLEQMGQTECASQEDSL